MVRKGRYYRTNGRTSTSGETEVVIPMEPISPTA